MILDTLTNDSTARKLEKLKNNLSESEATYINNLSYEKLLKLKQKCNQKIDKIVYESSFNTYEQDKRYVKTVYLLETVKNEIEYRKSMENK